MEMVNRKTKLCFGFLWLISAIILWVGGIKAYPLSRINSVLSSANEMFVALKKHDYKKVWSLLTITSKNKVVNDICSIMLRNFEKKCDRNKLYSDFKNGTGDAIYYWNSYLKYFDPEMVLKESRWQIKFIKNNRAVISIKYEGAPYPFFLKLKRENGKWKVGLLESVLK